VFRAYTKSPRVLDATDATAHLDGPSGRTGHLNLEEALPGTADRARISGLARHNFGNPHQRQKPSVDIVHVIERILEHERNGLPSIAKLRRGTGNVENFSDIGLLSTL
jgi:hypothetical protein